MSSYPIFMQWLAKQTPAIWHEVVMSWGEWDTDLSPIEWIAHQSNCDRATAILIFESAGADEWKEYAGTKEFIEDDPRPSAPKCFELCAFVIERWSRGMYQHASFADLGLNKYFRKFDGGKPAPWVIPVDMFEPSVAPKRQSRDALDRMNEELSALGLKGRTAGCLVID